MPVGSGPFLLPKRHHSLEEELLLQVSLHTALGHQLQLHELQVRPNSRRQRLLG